MDENIPQEIVEVYRKMLFPERQKTQEEHPVFYVLVGQPGS